jgi:hypothetical protein
MQGTALSLAFSSNNVYSALAVVDQRVNGQATSDAKLCMPATVQSKWPCRVPSRDGVVDKTG